MCMLLCAEPKPSRKFVHACEIGSHVYEYGLSLLTLALLTSKEMHTEGCLLHSIHILHVYRMLHFRLICMM